MKAVRFAGPITVQCDELGCGWSKEVEEIEQVLDWYNVPCPACGQGVIINEEYAGIAQTMAYLAKLAVPEQDTITIELDTSELR